MSVLPAAPTPVPLPPRPRDDGDDDVDDDGAVAAARECRRRFRRAAVWARWHGVQSVRRLSRPHAPPPSATASCMGRKRRDRDRITRSLASAHWVWKGEWDKEIYCIEMRTRQRMRHAVDAAINSKPPPHCGHPT